MSSNSPYLRNFTTKLPASRPEFLNLESLLSYHLFQEIHIITIPYLIYYSTYLNNIHSPHLSFCNALSILSDGPLKRSFKTLFYCSQSSMAFTTFKINRKSFTLLPGFAYGSWLPVQPNVTISCLILPTPSIRAFTEIPKTAVLSSAINYLHKLFPYQKWFYLL